MNPLVFNLPAWLAVSLFVGGVVVFVVGNVRLKDGVRNAGVVIVLAAIAWVGVSYFVDTPLEKSIDRTHAIVDAVDRQDWPALAALLDRGTQCLTLRGGEEIARVTSLRAGEVGFKSARVLTTRSQFTDTTCDVVVTVNADLAYPAPVTIWQFNFEKRADGILLEKFFPLSMQGQSSVDMIERRLRN
jgi:hypothetical protein